MYISYVLAENAALGLMVASGLFLFGSSRHFGSKVAGALLILVVFLLILGMLSDQVSDNPQNKRTGLALALFFVPLGIISALVKFAVNRVAKNNSAQPRIEPPIS